MINLDVAQAELSRQEVASGTQSGVIYIVRLVGGLPVACTCLGWIHGIRRDNDFVCKHMRQVFTQGGGNDQQSYH